MAPVCAVVGGILAQEIVKVKRPFGAEDHCFTMTLSVRQLGEPTAASEGCLVSLTPVILISCSAFFPSSPLHVVLFCPALADEHTAVISARLLCAEPRAGHGVLQVLPADSPWTIVVSSVVLMGCAVCSASHSSVKWILSRSPFKGEGGH